MSQNCIILYLRPVKMLRPISLFNPISGTKFWFWWLKSELIRNLTLESNKKWLQKSHMCFNDFFSFPSKTIFPIWKDKLGFWSQSKDRIKTLIRISKSATPNTPVLIFRMIFKAKSFQPPLKYKISMFLTEIGAGSKIWLNFQNPWIKKSLFILLICSVFSVKSS